MSHILYGLKITVFFSLSNRTWHSLELYSDNYALPIVCLRNHVIRISPRVPSEIHTAVFSRRHISFPIPQEHSCSAVTASPRDSSDANGYRNANLGRGRPKSGDRKFSRLSRGRVVTFRICERQGAAEGRGAAASFGLPRGLSTSLVSRVVVSRLERAVLGVLSPVQQVPPWPWH